MPRDGYQPKPGQTQNPLGDRIVAVLTRENGALQLHPTKEKVPSKNNIDPRDYDLGDAKEGDIVVLNTAKHVVTKVLGTRETPGIIGLISFYEAGGLSHVFNEAVLKEAEGLAVPDLGDREDLRNLPLVTVDGDDSRDFDDAIHAVKKADGGYHLTVAIADVSYYVRPGSELDQEAYRRGNSYYYPDGVVPMLPEALSNGICSLKPNEDRAVMVYHLDIDKDGNLTDYKINRGLMRSAARITYDELQAAKDGKPSEQLKPLMDTVVNPLYDAYEILKKAALARGKVELHGDPRTAASHFVIEEFMVLANTAGDAALKQSIHRYHPAPSGTKLEELGLFLRERGLKLPADVSHPTAFSPLLQQIKGRPDERQILSAISRAQSKAVYDAFNDGHYGLALLPEQGQGYAHHTSPIRRYSDLENHRLLVEAFNLGAGGITSSEKSRLQEISTHITETEIIATKSERYADDRQAAKLLEPHIGKSFKGHISGVIKGGVFVKLAETGAEGYVRLSALPDDIYTVDKETRTCTGQNGHVFHMGDELEVSVVRADSLTGDVLLSAGGTGKYYSQNSGADHTAGKKEMAAALQDHIGESYSGTIVNVTKAGLFVRMDGMKEDALVPFRNLPNDYYELDAAAKSCKGRDSGATYKAGDKIDVKVARVELDRGHVYLAANDNAKGAARPQPNNNHKKGQKHRGPRHR